MDCTCPHVDCVENTSVIEIEQLAKDNSLTIIGKVCVEILVTKPSSLYMCIEQFPSSVTLWSRMERYLMKFG